MPAGAPSANSQTPAKALLPGPAPPGLTQLPPSWSCADSRGLRLLLLRSMSPGFHHCQINGSGRSGGMLVAAHFAGPTGLALGTQSGPRPLGSTWTRWEAASYPWGQLSAPATEGCHPPMAFTCWKACGCFSAPSKDVFQAHVSKLLAHVLYRTPMSRSPPAPGILSLGNRQQ